jgi:hypothetical protein
MEEQTVSPTVNPVVKQNGCKARFKLHYFGAKPFTAPTRMKTKVLGVETPHCKGCKAPYTRKTLHAAAWNAAVKLQGLELYSFEISTANKQVNHVWLYRSLYSHSLSDSERSLSQHSKDL